MRYADLVAVYTHLDTTTKRLEKTHIIATFLKHLKENIEETSLLLQGKVLPNWDERKIGVASRLIVKAINIATGISTKKVEEQWKKKGDLGLVAEHLTTKKKQTTLFSQHLTVKKVFDNLRKLPEREGQGSVEQKVSLIAELLTNATPAEAKYIVKTVLEELRAGVGEMSFRDAIVWAYFDKELGLQYKKEKNTIEIDDREKYNEYVNIAQRFYDLKNDFGQVITTAKKHGLKGLKKAEIELGKPIKVMLALKVNSIEEGFERVGKPAEIEYKYDGFRMQISKDKEIKIFTRRLENVTTQFPEVISYIKKNINAKSFILDAEAVGYDAKTKHYVPFQNISQRIKRKYNIQEIAARMPVEINIFDIIYYNGENLIDKPLQERKKILKKVVHEVKGKGILAKSITTSDEKKVKSFFNESIKLGNEGLMFKNLDAPYKPGGRVGYMVKLKAERETLDLAVVGAEWGEGKRAKFLSSYYIACRDENDGLHGIGKVASGIKEKENEEGVTLKQMTDLLTPLILGETGRNVTVKPEIIIEVKYEEVQKSPTYDSGFALRFPRIIRLRHMDKSIRDVATLPEIKENYKKQKKK